MHKLSKMDCRYGASMGRANRDITNAGPIKMHLEVVQLDSGGYDSGGAYWGLRMPQPYTYPSGHTVNRPMRLYRYWWSGNIDRPNKPIIIEGFLDAWDRQDAKDGVREKYPQAKFFR